MAESLTVLELAEKWGVSGKTIRRLIDQGKLGYLRVGDRVVIRQADVELFEKDNGRPAGRSKTLASRILNTN